MEMAKWFLLFVSDYWTVASCWISLRAFLGFQFKILAAEEGIKFFIPEFLLANSVINSRDIEGFFGKKQYAAMALKVLVMKLADDWCLKCSIWAMFLSLSFTDSTKILLRNIILSMTGISEYFMLFLTLVTSWIPFMNRNLNSCLVWGIWIPCCERESVWLWPWTRKVVRACYGGLYCRWVDVFLSSDEKYLQRSSAR